MDLTFFKKQKTTILSLKVWEFLLWFQISLDLLVLCPFWFSFVFVTHLESGVGLEPTSPRTRAATVPSGPSSALRRLRYRVKKRRKLWRKGSHHEAEAEAESLSEALDQHWWLQEVALSGGLWCRRCWCKSTLRIYHHFTVRTSFESVFK